MPSLTVQNISKRFVVGKTPGFVLNDVSFSLPENTVTCLLGPNGAGKTTLLKTIATLLIPEKGRVLLGDLDVHGDPVAAKRFLGYASTESHSFYGRLSGRLNLWFYAQLFGLTAEHWKHRLSALNDDLDFDGFLNAPFRELSGGQKQRLLLARSLLHDPPVLLLDEPHQNLDPGFVLRFRDLIARWSRREGKTILISTHRLEDAEKIADRWVVLAEGRVRFDGSIAQEKEADPAFNVESFFQRLTTPEATDLSACC